MAFVQDIIEWLKDFAPLDTAAEWDNTGLLLGAATGSVKRIMTCLTLSQDVASEAIAENVDLIITHHPLMLRGIKEVAGRTPEARSIIMLLKMDVAVYCPHTAFDNCRGGINDMLSAMLGVTQTTPLVTRSFRGKNVGEGRIGACNQARTLAEIAEILKRSLGISQISAVGAGNKLISKIAVVCGAGGDFIADALAKGADLLVTGECRFHDAILARDSGLALLLPGHFASERFAVEALALLLKKSFPELAFWSSKGECDPQQLL